MALAEIDDHARVGVFAEEIPVFRLEFLHRLVEFVFEQFGGGFFGLGDVGARSSRIGRPDYTFISFPSSSS